MMPQHSLTSGPRIPDIEVHLQILVEKAHLQILLDEVHRKTEDHQLLVVDNNLFL
jgi:hypothetical protein